MLETLLYILRIVLLFAFRIRLLYAATGWVEDATYEIHYGNITGKPFYDASMMRLRSTDYARNSKGKSVLVKETGWAAADATPTHIILQFSSSHGGAYVGTVGNTFWVDNVGLVY